MSECKIGGIRTAIWEKKREVRESRPDVDMAERLGDSFGSRNVKEINHVPKGQVLGLFGICFLFLI